MPRKSSLERLNWTKEKNSQPDTKKNFRSNQQNSKKKGMKKTWRCIFWEPEDLQTNANFWDITKGSKTLISWILCHLNSKLFFRSNKNMNSREKIYFIYSNKKTLVLDEEKMCTNHKTGRKNLISDEEKKRQIQMKHFFSNLERIWKRYFPVLRKTWKL